MDRPYRAETQFSAGTQGAALRLRDHWAFDPLESPKPSAQALNSPAVQLGMKDILLNYASLYDSLRAKAAA